MAELFEIAEARIDPGRLLEELERRPVQNAWEDGYVRRAAVRALRGNFEEASTFAESVRDPSFRATCYQDLHDALPDESTSPASARPGLAPG